MLLCRSAYKKACVNCTWVGHPRNDRLCPRCGRYGTLREDDTGIEPPTKKGKSTQRNFIESVSNFFSDFLFTKTDEQPTQQGNSTHEEGNSTQNILLAPPIDFDPTDYGIKDHQDDEHHTQSDKNEDTNTTTIHNDFVTTPQQQPPAQAPHYTAQTNGYDNLSSTYDGSERVGPHEREEGWGGTPPRPRPWP